MGKKTDKMLAEIYKSCDKLAKSISGAEDTFERYQLALANELKGIDLVRDVWDDLMKQKMSVNDIYNHKDYISTDKAYDKVNKQRVDLENSLRQPLNEISSNANFLERELDGLNAFLDKKQKAKYIFRSKKSLASAKQTHRDIRAWLSSLQPRMKAIKDAVAGKR